MKVPLSWLSDYVAFKSSPEVLAEKLLLSGTKVEAIIKEETDSVLDLEITSNRPDCLSIIGVAREVSVIENSELKLPKVPTLVRKSHLAKIDLVVKDSDAVIAFDTVVLDHITVGESPKWLKKRLESSGMRSINNVVDITNYVMLEIGIPMHAFDADKLKGLLTVRLSKQDEQVTTLDGKIRSLPEGTIIIEDEKQLVDLAGIMGGVSSEILPRTCRILLHVPIYNPLRIRRASKAVSLRTESSTRFEKQLDLAAASYALHRAVSLMEKFCGARVASEILEKRAAGYYPKTITFDPILVGTILGYTPSTVDISRILRRLGFTIRSDKQKIRVTPPSWRRDIVIAEDIVEETARHIGYMNIPKTLPSGSMPTPPELFTQDYGRKVSDLCVSLGFMEHYGYTLTAAQHLEKLGFTSIVKLANPMSKEFNSLRPVLMVSLLPALAHNQKFTQNVQLFELGRIFKPTKKNLPDQPWNLALVSYGQNWEDFRGKIETLLTLCRLKPEITPNSYPLLHPQEAASILGGIIGSVHPKVLQTFGIKGPVWYFEIPFDDLKKALASPWHTIPISPYPPLKHDLTFSLPKGRPIGPAFALIQKAGGDELGKIEFINAYEENPSDRKIAYTVRLNFQSHDHSLSEKEAITIQEAINQALIKAGAILA